MTLRIGLLISICLLTASQAWGGDDECKPQKFRLQLPPGVTSQLINLLKRLERDSSLVPSELRAYEALHAAGDALVIKHGGSLKFMRLMLSQGLSKGVERDLHGDEVLYAAKIGTTYVVITVQHTPQGRMEFLHTINGSDNKINFYEHSKIERLTLPDGVGDVFYFDKQVVIVTRVDTGTNADSIASSAHQVTLGGTIESVNLRDDIINGMSLLELKFKSRYTKQTHAFIYAYHRKIVRLMETTGTYQIYQTENRVYIVSQRINEEGQNVTDIARFIPRNWHNTILRETIYGFMTIHEVPKSVTPRYLLFDAEWVSPAGGRNHQTQLVIPTRLGEDIRDVAKEHLNMAYASSTKNPKRLGCMLLIEPRVMYEDDQQVIIRTNDRAFLGDASSISQGLVILQKDNWVLQVRRRADVDVDDGDEDYFKVLQSPDVSFRSTIPISHIEADPEHLGPNLLIARFEGQDGPNAPAMLIDVMSGQWMIVPGYQRAQLQEFDGKQFLFLFGRIPNTPVAAFTMYDFETRTFFYGPEYDETSFVQNTRFFPTDLKFSYDGMMMPSMLVAQDLNAIQIRQVPDTPILFFDAEIGLGNDHGVIRYLFDMRHPDYHTALYNPREIQVEGDSGQYVVMSGEGLSCAFDGAPEDAGRPSSALIFLRRRVDGEDVATPDATWHEMSIPGDVETVRFLTPDIVVGEGRQQLISGQTDVEFRWNLNQTKPDYILENKIKDPLYVSEEGDFEIYVTRGTADSSPRVMMRKFGDDPSDDVWEEIELKLPKQVQRVVEVFLFTTKVDEIEFVRNDAEIDKVERDGNLLFITTASSDTGGSTTFVYSLKKRSMVFSIPNYVAHRDFGPFRFYIGNASFFNKTHVVVFHRLSHRFIEDFDFGQTRLDATSDDCVVRDSKKKLIYFKTANGHIRVFDERMHYFFGLLPDKIQEKLEPVESLGSVVNRIIFEGHQDLLLQRDGFFGRIQEQFSMTDNNVGAKYLMIVGESGTGRTLFLHEFVSRYISGQLSPQPDYRVVFFSIDPTALTSDTMFRGQFADKFKNLKTVADQLLQEGYRLVLLIDDMDNFKEDWHSDSEGDIFSQLKTLIENRNFDIMATATPDGLQRLTNRQAPLMANFHEMRIPHMSEAAAFEALKQYVQMRFPDRSIIDDSTLQSLIARVNRLSIHRQLPGSAFDVLKRVINTKVANGEVNITITRQDMNLAMAEQSGVPSMLFDRLEMNTQIPAMRTYLNTRIRNQARAVEGVMGALTRFAMEFGRNDWPIMRMLFLGPTGVGKTELARGISQFLFNDEKHLLKISGEDYAGSVVDIRRLKEIIVNHIKRYPCNVLLIDEFEKMHPEARQVLLSLADGNIADEEGRAVSSSLTILLATSNLGAMQAREAASREVMGFGHQDENRDQRIEDEMAEAYLTALHQGNIPPEIVNRFDDHVVFHGLNDEMARQICHDYLMSPETLATQSVASRFSARGFQISFDESIIDYLMHEHMDVRYGARRLAISIENTVVTHLSELAMTGQMEEGRSYVFKRVDDEFVLEEIE